METHTTPRSITPRDFFFNLGIIAALYTSAISLITLLFNIINLLFPDQLENYYDPYSSQMRFAIAALVIFFPVYLILGWLHKKETAKNPEKRTSGLRKWLVYFTLFVTGVTIVVDLVVLLNSFLGGEITSRFVLKVVAVLVVAGLVFAYYILNLRGTTNRKEVFGAFVVLGTVLVLASLVGGFMIMGSPARQRMLRFDSKRVSDLQGIQWQVVSFYQSKQRLPATLTEVQDPLSGVHIPLDPSTELPYEYIASTTSRMSFDLCATFDLSSTETGLTGRNNTSIAYPAMYDDGISNNWKYEAGKTCFTRTVDPEKYPPITKFR